MEQEYELILKENNLELYKKKNKYKINLFTDVNKNCKIIEHFKNNKIFEILKDLNKKFINDIIYENEEIIFILNNLYKDSDEDSDENDSNDLHYFTLKKSIISETENSLVLMSENTDRIYNEKYHKIYLDKIIFDIKIKNNKLNITIKLKYNGNKLEKHKQHLFCMIISKIFSKLIKFYNMLNQS